MILLDYFPHTHQPTTLLGAIDGEVKQAKAFENYKSGYANWKKNELAAQERREKLRGKK